MPFIVTTRDELMHSAKGSTWKDHKYIKKVGNKYVYPEAVETEKIITEKTIREDRGLSGIGYKASEAAKKKAEEKKKKELAAAKKREEERQKAQTTYAKKVAANNAAANALSNVKPGGKAKDTGAKKSTKNYNKQSDKKTKTAKTINDIVNAAVTAAKKKKKKK